MRRRQKVVRSFAWIEKSTKEKQWKARNLCWKEQGRRPEKLRLVGLRRELTILQEQTRQKKYGKAGKKRHEKWMEERAFDGFRVSPNLCSPAFSSFYLILIWRKQTRSNSPWFTRDKARNWFPPKTTMESATNNKQRQQQQQQQRQQRQLIAVFWHERELFDSTSVLESF